MSRREIRLDGAGILLLALVAACITLAMILGGIRPTADAATCTEECLARADLAAQSSMAWAAWAMLSVSAVTGGVGFLSLILIYRTLREAQRSADEAKRSADAAEAAIRTSREIGIAQTRAYLSFDKPVLEIKGGHMGMSLKLDALNAGQSPAIGVRIAVTIRHEEVLGRNKPVLVFTMTTQHGDIPAGQRRTLETYGLSLFEELKFPEKDDTVTTTNVTAVISFKDVFGNEIVESITFLVYNHIADLPLGKEIALTRHFRYSL